MLLTADRHYNEIASTVEMALGREAILGLYRSLIREAKKWNSYNYRMYMLRKVRHEFQQNKTLKDAKEIQKQFSYGQDSLQMLKRQVLVGNLYSTKPLVVENKKPIRQVS